ncbi:sugar phosphate isomerase/epimerase family protein [Planococcus ruber]|uniref:sugar phosphate isomerase/epimerase family protein n=1 Tax=Planococcus ruber TaxID=2027871 RepID=UPI001FF026C9|nr:sugar phosphate isomerase/epimerase family protein [Planococcus ruber]MCJ1908336.1 sugar phosphate isomerase/epimerase [Planococcus ruber]
MEKSMNFLPTILMPEIYRPFTGDESFFVSKIEEIAEEGFYRGIEIASIHDKEKRKQIREVTSASQLIVTQWMTAIITEQGLNLSAVDEKERQYAVEEIIKNIEWANEAGASNIALVTGPDPGEELRKKAGENLIKSLSSICAEAKSYGLEVLVEPLDRHAHKKMFLGPTEDTYNILSTVKKNHPNIGYAFDTAHAALNEEEIETAIELAGPLINQLHLSNAVLNPVDPLYGDHHIPLGAPGFLTYERAVSILEKVKMQGLFAAKPFRISIEVRTNENENAHSTELQAKQFLKRLLTETNG